jgi:hypothetical protein
MGANRSRDNIGPRRRAARIKYGGRYLALVLMMVVALTAAAAPAADDDPLRALKAAFIYKFTSFVDWPAAQAGTPFVICVMADPAMQAALAELTEPARRVGERLIRVRGLAGVDSMDGCQILFIGAAAGRLGAIARRSAGKPVLLVGDTPGFAGKGAAIELFDQSDIFRKKVRLRFRIDPKALKGRGLTVSAQLYDVAEVVQ